MTESVLSSAVNGVARQPDGDVFDPKLPLCLNAIHERLGIIHVVVRVELGHGTTADPRVARPVCGRADQPRREAVRSR